MKNEWSGFVTAVVLIIGAGIGGYEYGKPKEAAAVEKVPVVPVTQRSGDAFTTPMFNGPIVTPGGDVYVDDSNQVIWMIRQNEALPVRVVEKFSHAATTQSSQAVSFSTISNLTRRLSSQANQASNAEPADRPDYDQ
jgi:hypothetical protein